MGNTACLVFDEWWTPAARVQAIVCVGRTGHGARCIEYDDGFGGPTDVLKTPSHGSRSGSHRYRPVAELSGFRAIRTPRAPSHAAGRRCCNGPRACACPGRPADVRRASPAICLERLSINSSDQIVYQLKHPFRDGTTHVLFSPEDFVARLAALVPRPGFNLTRCHGVFAPSSAFGHAVVPDAPQRQGKDTIVSG